MKKTRVYLIRHGETEWNQYRRFQGHSDVELSAQGRHQARRLLLRLAGEPLDHIYASDLRRAAETARIIAEARSVPLEEDRRFRECHFGHWEGMTFAEIHQAYPEESQTWMKAPNRFQAPGGESFADVQQRTYPALLERVEQHVGQSIAIVAHGGTLRILLCAILGVDLDRAWQFRQDNTALNIIDFLDDTPFIERINDVTHLQAGAFPEG
ncbi:alpha-ribazole phosphatase [Heliophilum fasciatum]|uniref:Alpha-ribazole phosphatase n=1 Tax=Heliophilum fasciatum TaxID=35700 RepID=A0A4R2RU99_9FIRM|nr:alpha-ribazole phosphatase [Heliophilum fasciatum]MCW2278546.1 alpha-ribazole phosphatase [Heliophilum fasciatum]TCP63501.1 phosphoglycerate mutase [Heliophilum fasciatum]